MPLVCLYCGVSQMLSLMILELINVTGDLYGRDCAAVASASGSREFAGHAGKGPSSGPQSSWPQLKLVTLVLQGTQVTQDCLQDLHVLTELEYLDMRCTAPTHCH